MRGRRKKPTALKIAEGNRGKRKLNRNEPMPELVTADSTEPPMELYEAERFYWDMYVPILRATKILTYADLLTLVKLCQYSHQHDLASAEVAKRGITIVCPIFSRNGDQVGEQIKENPAIKVQSDAMRHLSNLLSRFGLDPASRARLSVETGKSSGPGQPMNKLEEIKARMNNGKDS